MPKLPKMPKYLKTNKYLNIKMPKLPKMPKPSPFVTGLGKLPKGKTKAQNTPDCLVLPSHAFFCPLLPYHIYLCNLCTEICVICVLKGENKWQSR